MNVTSKQKEMLLTLLKENPDLVRGRIDRKTESRRKMVEYWDNIANIINAAAEGPRKNGKEWTKTWKDMKTYILKKESKRRTHTQGTGGGPPSNIVFSNFEEKVLQLLTPEAAGLLNIPEGGINETPYLLNNQDDVNTGESLTPEAAGLLNIPEGGINETPYLLNNQDDVNTGESLLNVPEREIIHIEESNRNECEREQITESDVEVTEINQRRKITKTKTAEKIKENKKRFKENSNLDLSRNMLRLQEKKYKLKKKHLKLEKTALNVQHEILSEIKNIKLSLQSWMTPETLI